MWRILFPLVFALHLGAVHADIPSNPFGPNVYIFDTSMKSIEINRLIQLIYEDQRFNEFGVERYALLFMPGIYGGDEHIDVRVGYYTHVLGLGKSPDQVLLIGAVRTQDKSPIDANHPEQGPGATTNFWRGAENMAILPTLGSLSYPETVPHDQNVWAAAQATFLRRIHIVQGSLRLFDLGYSSGGFIADSLIDKTVYAGTQKQWLTRNSSFSNWEGGLLNMVFSGVTGLIPGGEWPDPAYVVIERSPVIKEKPYLFYKTDSNEFALNLRSLQKNSSGTDWEAEGKIIPVRQCFIAFPNVTAAQLNAALLSHECLILTPGIYHLEDTVHVTQANTIIFGLGFPSLVNDTGKPILAVADVDGVQLAGILLEAGPLFSTTLLQIGAETSGLSHADNPIFLYDIFCRIGGLSFPGQSETCIEVNSDDVIADNLWLWRADHGPNVGWFVNKADTGIIVDGNNVIMYNLQVEHFQKYQTIWKGNNTKVIHYQSELPNDPPNQEEWRNGLSDGFASYKIDNSVLSHQAFGIGIYSHFTESDNIYLENAIEVPSTRPLDLQYMLTFWLGGHENTGIRHIVNNQGSEVNSIHQKSTLPHSPGVLEHTISIP
ncbi:hypothetical protein [Legionella sp. 16cNR16C]|uniref:hypothetical protein n=1 Tax=Legionella sp. 16cNR16C TaxID=2905656 RepID=UPI001E35EB4A|nr:hypothetical protein [Legionella sp. 16cNR16C]MCE3046220.1 hypothetical protein [Legionella sp. 16cNR16C]